MCLSDFIPRRRRESNMALVVQEKKSGKIPFRHVEKKRLIYSGKCCLQFLSTFVKPSLAAAAGAAAPAAGGRGRGKKGGAPESPRK